MKVWRICKKQFSESAFSGEGARLHSGRWNTVGVRMVYTSSSLALAALELFVHLDPTMAPDDLVSVAAIISPEVRIEEMRPKNLPADWRELDNMELQGIGSQWISEGRSAALRVPSVVIEDEWNILLNPAHPDFMQIQIEAPKPFHFDKRMFR